LLRALEGQPDFPALFDAFKEAQKGNGTLFKVNPIGSVFDVWAVAFICSDYRKPIITIHEISSDSNGTRYR
jgi:hypothetical protein